MHDRLKDSRFLKACRGEPTDATPIWLLRQAGRYLKEYREIKSRCDSFLQFCKTPDLAAQVTVDAQRILGVDAAILFADLLPILEPMGLRLEYLEGEGPLIANPVRTAADVDALRLEEPEQSMPFVHETIRRARAELPPDIPLIGFAGAPFTLASYAVEGQGSKHFAITKTLMYQDVGAWHELMQKLSRTVGDYLAGQIAAGVQAVQIFDSWVGCLGPADYRRYALPYTKAVIDEIGGRVPVIHFGTGAASFMEAMHEAGADVLGFDWRTPIAPVWDRLGCTAVQGNLDPIALCADLATVKKKAQEVLDDVGGRAGHIFNVGHGLVPKTEVENVIALVDYVHETTDRRRAR